MYQAQKVWNINIITDYETSMSNMFTVCTVSVCSVQIVQIYMFVLFPPCCNTNKDSLLYQARTGDTAEFDGNCKQKKVT